MATVTAFYYGKSIFGGLICRDDMKLSPSSDDLKKLFSAMRKSVSFSFRIDHETGSTFFEWRDIDNDIATITTTQGNDKREYDVSFSAMKKAALRLI